MTSIGRHLLISVEDNDVWWSKKRLMILLPVTACILTACGGSSVSQDNSVNESAHEVTLLSESTGEGATADPAITETAHTISEQAGVSVPRIISQKETVFGEMGCGGAAGLMALQAAGFMTELDSDDEYAGFWESVPKSNDVTKGYNASSGIWNPAYADWLATFTDAKRIEGFDTDDIREYISAGYVVIPLVSLGESGRATHWFAVTAWKIQDGLLLFDVADPWSGALHEYTASRLQARIEEGAKRKGDFGQGYETDGVLIKVGV